MRLRRELINNFLVAIKCEHLYLYLYLFSVQNIHERDTEHCQHSVHTDNNKYIQFKVPNIIIKTAKLHN
jgi:hypothetical protein